MANIIIPIIIMTIVIYGMMKGVKVYECFVEGAKDGMKICINIFPYMLAMLLAIGVLRESTALDYIISFVNPIVKYIGLPGEVLPLVFMKPLSGSGALGIYTDIITNYGADSHIGRVASVIMGSTETIFYTLTVYFGAIGIKKIRHTLWAAIIADISAVVFSVIILNLLY
ncbi:spore maturation protein B [Clostridium tetani]|uniref:Spore maturation protein B n=2 Tax=Clostridium tetani TaxID=1513 RepID=A0ABC8E8G1_CLOTA|nr:spore maturation protein [Clostridium tetani]CDI48290.1 spore maturation protein B [Clostridium tetani 12124569]BDR65842.1 spore maturation protein B [Clostridium tetani]BDR68657.1 spore maturation protein B [Clostridium tetani]BDR71363.1 spore maturation protein B [Clostridium tetani]